MRNAYPLEQPWDSCVDLVGWVAQIVARLAVDYGVQTTPEIVSDALYAWEGDEVAAIDAVVWYHDELNPFGYLPAAQAA